MKSDFAYRKLILRGRQLVDAMFVGNVNQAASLVQTFDRGDQTATARVVFNATCSGRRPHGFSR